MMEQAGVRDRQKYLVAKAIVEPEGKFTVCKILNASDNKIILRKHLQLARLTEIDVNSITEFKDQGENEKSEVVGQNASKRSLKNLGIDINNSNLTEEQRKELVTFLECNTDSFALELGDLPETTEGYCHIKTGSTPPIRQRAYRPSPQAREEISNQTADMLKRGIIVPSESP